MKRLAQTLARYHAVRAYIAAILGNDTGAQSQAMRSTLAERIATV